jgi:hypothetical protein
VLVYLGFYLRSQRSLRSRGHAGSGVSGHGRIFIVSHCICYLSFGTGVYWPLEDGASELFICNCGILDHNILDAHVCDIVAFSPTP